MKLFSVFRKSLREQSRDLVSLSLSLLLAPFFVLLYWLFFPSGSTTYDVLVIDNDRKAGSAGEALIDALHAVTYADGQPILAARLTGDRIEAEARLRDREAEVLLIIPDGFSETLEAVRRGLGPEPVAVTFVGDLTNPYYAVAAVMAGAGLDEYVQLVTQEPRTVLMEEIPLGASGARSEFEVYVPGLLVFAMILLVFQVSMLVAYEVEAGTLRRLQITRVTSFDFLGGLSASVIVVGILALLLAFVTALALGFRSHGSLWIAILVGVLTCLAVIGTGLVVAAFSKTVSQAFLIANFPLILFMFFSGAIYPLPKVALFEVAGRTIGLYDILPPTHAVVALNKVLTLGAGLGEVAFELTMLVILSLVYFVVGVWCFQRKQMRVV